eukprot:TRINITY_DN2812_c0_g1_i1.p5 TRINITY_DN2812_c0_g1~~TRINITY_DN2812_c0_g1_i1.p5  ORF type:complete len:56 (-),score=4.64 TRINITY_DN2812_c0_g1_i1:836-1003(-)
MRDMPNICSELEPHDKIFWRHFRAILLTTAPLSWTWFAAISELKYRSQRLALVTT